MGLGLGWGGLRGRGRKGGTGHGFGGSSFGGLGGLLRVGVLLLLLEDKFGSGGLGAGGVWGREQEVETLVRGGGKGGQRTMILFVT